MKEKEFIAKLKTKEDKLLLSYVLDKYYQFKKSGISTSSNFLNERELKFLENSLTYLNVPYITYRPNELCERSIIYFGSYQSFISIYKIKIQNVKHSDILGSLFGSGLSESMIGDIFVLEQEVYITNLEKYDFLLETSLTKIGRNSIK